MIALHEAAGEGGAGIEAYLSALQEADDRIDIVRAVWNEQMADTHRLLDALTWNGRRGCSNTREPEPRCFNSANGLSASPSPA
jgi:trans-aconitate methyltransferase